MAAALPQGLKLSYQVPQGESFYSVACAPTFHWSLEYIGKRMASEGRQMRDHVCLHDFTSLHIFVS